MAAKKTALPDWQTFAKDPKFKAFLVEKTRFIIPAVIFYVIYYFALPVLVGYAPSLMATKVWGQVNLAYLFALSQFFMAWILAYIYLRVAAGFDTQSAALLKSKKGARR